MTAPHARSGDGLRVLRAAVFAAVCVVLAAAGHSLASCATVPWWTLGAGFAGALVVVAPLAGRERSLPGIATLLALGQTVLHVLFGLGQHGTTSMAMSSMPRTSDAALVQQAARLLCGTTAAAISPAQAHRLLVEARLYPATGTGSGGGTGVGTGGAHAMTETSGSAGSSALSLLPSLPMLLGHVLAAVAAGWLLRRGDLALLRLAELSTYSAHSMAEGALVRSLRAALALVRALRAGLPGAPEAGPRAPLTASLTPPRPRTRALQHTVIRRGPPAAGLVLAA
ncbi:hypothetical protein [Streptomyces griseorubiginosus]|uniref:Integral membrane protein n=1 Tax=Streptomyces griseorubiginosus TaxID=67304 RepID=A0AAI8L309_9ACTN|nr:hypothetical protein [Streptomyces griseorubiginosus]AYC40088.1 hypothetical protein DWG14_04335 [Streptomyces griseorubiginosus]